MILPRDHEYLEAIRHPHAHQCWANVYSGNQLVAENVKIVEGSVTADADQLVRYTASCVLDFSMLSPDQIIEPLNVYTTRVALYASVIGVDAVPDSIARSKLVLPLGVYRVASLSLAYQSLLQMDLEGLEGYVIDDMFFAPQTLVKDLFGTGDAKKSEIPKMIEHLIKQTFHPFKEQPDHTQGINIGWTPPTPSSGVVFHNQTTYDTDTNFAIGINEPFDRDRWGTIKRLADNINATVYCGPDGAFYLRDSPSKRTRYSEFPYVWVVRKGQNGVMTSMSENVTRDDVFNAIVAHNDSVAISDEASDTENTTAVWAVVVDDDPESPVRWTGPFGRKPKFLEFQEIRTVQQAKWYAIYNLNDAYGANRQVSFETVPNFALEPDDLVYVERLDGSFERHQITSLTFPLTHDGKMTAQTKAKSDLRWLTWGQVPPNPTDPSDKRSYIWEAQTSQWKKVRNPDDLIGSGIDSNPPGEVVRP